MNDAKERVQIMQRWFVCRCKHIYVHCRYKLYDKTVPKDALYRCIYTLIHHVLCTVSLTRILSVERELIIAVIHIL